MKTTTTGTNHFTSRYAAVKYYDAYGYDQNDVIDKIAKKEIHIGAPEVGPNQTLVCDKDSRYHTTTTEQDKAQSAVFHLGHGYDTLEVHTVLQTEEFSEAIPSGDDIPEEASICFSLYGHIPGEGVECIGDFIDFEAACEVARKLGGYEKEPVFNDYTKQEFIEFLEETLIPDLKESGMEATATDFETAIKFINN